MCLRDGRAAFCIKTYSVGLFSKIHVHLCVCSNFHLCSRAAVRSGAFYKLTAGYTPLIDFVAAFGRCGKCYFRVFKDFGKYFRARFYRSVLPCSCFYCVCFLVRFTCSSARFRYRLNYLIRFRLCQSVFNYLRRIFNDSRRFSGIKTRNFAHSFDNVSFFCGVYTVERYRIRDFRLKAYVHRYLSGNFDHCSRAAFRSGAFYKLAAGYSPFVDFVAAFGRCGKFNGRSFFKFCARCNRFTAGLCID